MYEEERQEKKARNEVMGHGECLISSLSMGKGAFSSQRFETSLIITQDLRGREWRRRAEQRFLFSVRYQLTGENVHRMSSAGSEKMFNEILVIFTLIQYHSPVYTVTM